MTREIKPLTSFRGIAAFMVLIYHVRVLNEWTFPLDDYTTIILRGYLWVDFFFVLSGFILAYVYGSTFIGAFGRRDYLTFLRRRLLRIYPLHLATLLLFVPLVASDLLLGDRGHPNNETPLTYAVTFVYNLLLIQAWNIADGLSWNQPAWSISAEWAAYLMFPVFFLVIYRLRLMWASSFVILGLLFLYALMLLHPNRVLDIHFNYGVLRCFAGFCLGILVYRVYERLRERGDEHALGRDRVCLLVLALIPLLLHAPVHDVWLLPVFALLILAAALNRGATARVLETPVLYGLGLISYSLYMTHWFVLDVSLRVRDGLIGGEPGAPVIAGLMVAAILATVGLSILTYRYVEQPFRRWPWRRPPHLAPAAPVPLAVAVPAGPVAGRGGRAAGGAKRLGPRRRPTASRVPGREAVGGAPPHRTGGRPGPARRRHRPRISGRRR